MSSIQNQFLIPFRKRAESKQMQRMIFLLRPGLLFAFLIRPINRTAIKVLSGICRTPFLAWLNQIYIINWLVLFGIESKF